LMPLKAIRALQTCVMLKPDPASLIQMHLYS
jgi:hypothetical protein